MTNVFETIKTDAEGNVLSMKSTQEPSIRVRSDQIMPKGMALGTAVFIVDKMDIAMSDGRDNWYREKDKPVPAGQPFSALFA